MENNIFHLLAQSMWRRGDDGEKIARELAQALMELIKEGTTNNPADEFIRLIKQDNS